MDDWNPSNQPPRLTPPPLDELDLTPNENLRPAIPLRKSIYPHPRKPTWYVNVIPYNDNWPLQYNHIATHLSSLFNSSDPPIPYLTIEHIGSTAVPNLAAKPNIDVLATFATIQDLQLAVEALNWEIPKEPPFVKYTQCPNGGGIPGRESFKIYLFEDDPWYTSTPERSVYLIADTEENVAGKCHIQCYRTLRDVLRDAQNVDLLIEYGQFKLKLAKEEFSTGLEYAERKNNIIRKILVRGGWTDTEVDEKERIAHREWNSNDEKPY